MLWLLQDCQEIASIILKDSFFIFVTAEYDFYMLFLYFCALTNSFVFCFMKIKINLHCPRVHNDLIHQNPAKLYRLLAGAENMKGSEQQCLFCKSGHCKILSIFVFNSSERNQINDSSAESYEIQKPYTTTIALTWRIKRTQLSTEL